MKFLPPELLNTITSISTAITGIAALFLIYSQLEQLNKLKRFENYVYFNKAYDDWYSMMPKSIKMKNKIDKINWEDLTNDERSWIRRYFDLYAQEYFFYLQDMIPKEMWEEHINGKTDRSGSAFLNFKEYPLLIEGYHKWKSLGAFEHPSGFTTMVDKKINEF